LGFKQKDIDELKNFGDVVAYDGLSKNHDEWLDKCEGADIILTGKFGLKNRYQNLHNCFLALPFVGVGFFDREILKDNNITVSYCPGCNRDAVSEWIVGMMVNLLREFPLCEKLGKVPIHIKKEVRGFVLNRIIAAIKREAMWMLEMGVASFEDIDKACVYGAGHPMGPFRLNDLTGLDLSYDIAMELFRETGDMSNLPSPQPRQRQSHN
jgi:hypothetical protein